MLMHRMPETPASESKDRHGGGKFRRNRRQILVSCRSGDTICRRPPQSDAEDTVSCWRSPHRGDTLCT